MELRIPHIKRLCMLMSICAALTSCIYDDETAYDDIEGDELTVGFCIAVENASPLSRGTIDNGITDSDETWGDNYPAVVGSDFDSRIDLRTLRMALYSVDTDGSLSMFASFRTDDMFYFSSSSPDGGHTVYHLTAFFQTDKPLDEIRRGKYRVMIWVNTPYDITEMGNPDSLDGLSLGDGSVSDLKLIPMWGCATVNLAGIKPGEAYELKPEDSKDGDTSILLLRSISKTSVEASEETVAKYGADFKINSVALVHANRQGYVMPYMWKTLTDTRALRFDATAREMSGTDFWSFSTEKSVSGKFTVYLPEYINEDNSIHLSVDYTLKGVRKQDNIYFCKYENGKPLAPPDLNNADDITKYKDCIYDIVRNHHYRFSIEIDEKKTEIVIRSIRIEDWVYGGGGFLDPTD